MAREHRAEESPGCCAIAAVQVGGRHRVVTADRLGGIAVWDVRGALLATWRSDSRHLNDLFVINHAGHPLIVAIGPSGVRSWTLDGVAIAPPCARPGVEYVSGCVVAAAGRPTILLGDGQGAVECWAPSGELVWRVPVIDGPVWAITALLRHGVPHAVTAGAGRLCAVSIPDGRVSMERTVDVDEALAIAPLAIPGRPSVALGVGPVVKTFDVIDGRPLDTWLASGAELRRLALVPLDAGAAIAALDVAGGIRVLSPRGRPVAAASVAAAGLALAAVADGVMVVGHADGWNAIAVTP